MCWCSIAYRRLGTRLAADVSRQKQNTIHSRADRPDQTRRDEGHLGPASDLLGLQSQSVSPWAGSLDVPWVCAYCKLSESNQSTHCATVQAKAAFFLCRFWMVGKQEVFGTAGL